MKKDMNKSWFLSMLLLVALNADFAAICSKALLDSHYLYLYLLSMAFSIAISF
jgi:hypothetical protein